MPRLATLPTWHRATEKAGKAGTEVAPEERAEESSGKGLVLALSFRPSRKKKWE